MPWELYEEHIVHHVDRYRKEKQQLEEQDKHLTTKLAQLQLGELTERKKNNKDKIQAPVVSAVELPSKDPPLYGQMSPLAESMIPCPNGNSFQDDQAHRFPPFQVLVDVQPSGGRNVSQQ